MDQTSATPPAAVTAQSRDQGQPVDGARSGATAEPVTAANPESIGFAARGRVRRRARFLRKARELAYRDLGGLVFNLHRFAQRNDALVLAKLNTLGKIDAELRTLEAALSERQPVTVLREAGITACLRCAAIHSGEDRFCPNCGLPGGRHPDLPISGQPVATATAPSPAAGRTSSPGGPAAAKSKPAAAQGASQAATADARDQPTEVVHPPGAGR